MPFGSSGALFHSAAASTEAISRRSLRQPRPRAQRSSTIAMDTRRCARPAVSPPADVTIQRQRLVRRPPRPCRGRRNGELRKHVADVAWDSETPIGDHTALRIEGRLNAGWLRGGDAAPIAERFRGGNREETFLDSGSWNIRSNPLLRSLPSNQFDRTSADAALGGDRFVAMNLTLSAPVWRYPLIPVWLFSNTPASAAASRRQRRPDGIRRSSITIAQDPAQKLMAADAARVASVLDTLFDRLSAAQDLVAPAHRDAFDDCLDAADTARDKMNHLKEPGSDRWRPTSSGVT